MICRNCGTQIPDGEMFCPKCGEEVRWVPDYSSVEYLLAQKKRQELEQPPEVKTEPPKKRHSTLRIVLVILLVLTAAAAVLIGIKSYVDNRNLNDYSYQIRHAENAYHENNFTDALTYIGQALRLNPTSDEAVYLKANIYVAQKNYNEAIPALQDLIGRNPQDTDSYRQLIGIYEEQGKPEEIKALLADAAEEIKEEYSAYIAKAPVFDPAEGSYDSLISVTLKAQDEVIYYTTDGTDPTVDSTEYHGEIKTVEGNNEIRAMAVNAKGITSEIAYADYEVTLPVPDSAFIYPSSGNYVPGTMITVRFPADCKAYYVFDAVANDKGTEYTVPVEMPAGTHVFSIVVVNSFGKSSVAVSETYKVS